MKFGLFLLAHLIVSLIPLAGQAPLQGHRGDNSDWWSRLRAEDTNDNVAVQDRAPASSNFEIQNIDLGDDVFIKASAKLGKAFSVERGDASSSRSQICYSSVSNDPRVNLIFERGEVTDSFYLFENAPGWSGANLCVKRASLQQIFRSLLAYDWDKRRPRSKTF